AFAGFGVSGRAGGCFVGFGVACFGAGFVGSSRFGVGSPAGVVGSDVVGGGAASGVVGFGGSDMAGPAASGVMIGEELGLLPSPELDGERVASAITTASTSAAAIAPMIRPTRL